MAEQYQLFFIQRFKGKVLFDVPMSGYTSLKIGGAADVMAFPQDEADLKNLIQFASTKNFPIHILGGGANLLVRDRGIRGVVINMSEGFKDMEWVNSTGVIVGAGVKIYELISNLSKRGLSGLEFAIGIPATVGGAVTMNAGAYDREMKDVVEGVEVVTNKGKKGFLSKDEIGFSYRRTNIPADSIIVKAHMRFEKKDPDEIEKAILEYKKMREKKGSIKYPNAGSVFKNPEGDFAGRLIEEAGLKGHRIGNAEVSAVHANYIVNLGGACARDVLSLMALIRDTVYGRYGIVLEPEIKVIGED